jgi:hypothetical protein
MPYIASEVRSEFNRIIDRLPYEAMTVGDLTYVLYRILLKWTHCAPVDYGALASAMGAIQSIDSEFKKHVVQPYEYSKMMLNGPVL